MSTERRARIAEKIRKLMSHRDSAEAIGSIEEATVFAERISALLTKYRLSLEEVPLHVLDNEDPVDEYVWEPTDHGFAPSSRRQSWALQLAAVIARANGAEVLSAARTNIVFFIGRKHEREITAYLFTVLRRAIENEGDRRGRRLQPRPPHWTRSFRFGAVSALQDRYERLKEAQTSNETALIAQRDSEVAEEVDRRSSGTYGGSGSGGLGRLGLQGYVEGKEFAETLSITANAMGASGYARPPAELSD